MSLHRMFHLKPHWTTVLCCSFERHLTTLFLFIRRSDRLSASKHKLICLFIGQRSVFNWLHHDANGYCCVHINCLSAHRLQFADLSPWRILQRSMCSKKLGTREDAGLTPPQPQPQLCDEKLGLLLLDVSLYATARYVWCKTEEPALDITFIKNAVVQNAAQELLDPVGASSDPSHRQQPFTNRNCVRSHTIWIFRNTAVRISYIDTFLNFSQLVRFNPGTAPWRDPSFPSRYPIPIHGLRTSCTGCLISLQSLR